MTFRTSQLTRLLRPASVAIIGASTRKTAAGNEVLANLREERFPGDIHLVHPTGGEIDGRGAVTSVSALPEGLDSAVVSLPAPAVVGVLRELEEIGCQTALVPSTGFSGALEEEFKSFVDSSRMLVHGPNNMGLINVTDRIPLWIQQRGVSRIAAGNVAIVAQSGSAAIFLPRASREGMYSKVISSGSEWQLTSADYIEWLAHDDATEAIGLVLESISDPDRFRAAVATARAAGKPLAVLKVGRTEAGQRATTAHTGALSAADDAYRALFDDLDVPLLDDYDELAAALELMSRPSTRSSRGTRIAATTISGGQSALLADLAEHAGVEMAPLTDATRARLVELIPGGSPTVPVDTGGGTSDDVSYPEVLATLAADETVDAVVVVVDAQDTLTLVEYEVEGRAWDAVNAVYGTVDKPILMASSTGQSISRHFRDEVVVPVPIVRGFAPALAAVRAIAANRRPIREPGARPTGTPDAATVQQLRTEVAEHRGALPAALTEKLLDAYGITRVRSVQAADADQAVAVSRGIPFPLVAKVVSAAIPHRTEAGCVITDIADETALRDAVNTILHRATDAVGADAVEGIEIQEQVDTTLQAVVGFTSSEPHGAYVIVGSGGVLVEVLDDVAGALAPFSAERAAELIGQTRFARLLGGYRGIVPPTDSGPLADVAARVSVLAEDLRGLVAEMDLNPVLVTPATGAARIVDALIVASDEPAPVLA